MAAVATIVASAARTATGNSGAVQADISSRNLSVLVNVTAQSGTTPTLDFSVQWSADGTNFATPDGTADTITQFAAATGLKVKLFTVKGRFYRVVWTVAGTTPSFTFTVDTLEN